MRGLVVSLCGVLAACAGSTEGDGPAPAPKPVLRMQAPQSLMENLLPALVATHERTRGTLVFETTVSPPDRALDALLKDEVDIAASTRGSNPVETERAKARDWNLEAANTRHVVGIDVVAVTVHPDNELPSLTYDQVIGVFCAGTIDDWSFLGLEKGRLRALAASTDSGDRTLFEDFFCGPAGLHQGVEDASPDQVATALREDPAVITFSSSSQKVGRAVPLQPDTAGPPVEPSQQNVISGAYPLYRDVYFFSAGPAAGYGRSFLDWMLSPAGQEVVDEHGFMPQYLRPDRMDRPRPLRETIHFEAGRSVPNQRSMARLQLLVNELQARQAAHVVLEGYADNREERGLVIAEQRANAVRELLVSELPNLYFEITPRGATNPLMSNDTAYGRLRNRRVQVYVVPQGAPPGVMVDSQAKSSGG